MLSMPRRINRDSDIRANWESLESSYSPWSSDVVSIKHNCVSIYRHCKIRMPHNIPYRICFCHIEVIFSTQTMGYHSLITYQQDKYFGGNLLGLLLFP